MDALPPNVLQRVFLALAGSAGQGVQQSVAAVRLGQTSTTQLDLFAILAGLTRIEPRALTDTEFPPERDS